MVPHGILTKIINVMYSLQLSHCGGKYSIERVLALQEFTRTASLTRVILLVLAPPLVTIGVVLCQESIPLQDPRAGWRMNYGFWPRVGIVGMLLGSVLADLVGPWLDVPALSALQKLAYSTCVGIGLVAVGMATAEIWVFPIPFFIILLLVPMSFVFLLLLCPVVGIHKFRSIISRHDQLLRLNKVGWLLGLMCVGYPAFQMLFNEVIHTPYEAPVLLLLPAFKVIMRKLFAFFASHKWDIVPVEVVCTVDFFDALYLVTCMPNLSTASLVVILMVDLVQAIIDLLELYQCTQSILPRLRATTSCQNNTDTHNLLSTVRTLCYNSEAFQKKNLGGIQVRSCIPHRLSDEDITLLEKLETRISITWGSGKSPHNSSRKFSPYTPNHILTIPGRVRSTALIAVQPHPRVKFAKKQPSVDDIDGQFDKETRFRRTSTDDCSDILEETLGILWASECLILAEYVEIIVPVFYGTFMMVMVHLPSAQYHTEMEDVTRDNVGSMVSTMFVYALMELLSFVFLAGIMKRNCSIDALYQLAFVLETQMHFILSKLLVWMMFTLTYRVAHFGADFSFKFDWINGNC